MEFINFVVFQVFSQPSILLGIVALIGLLIQKRPFNQVVMGTLKTIIGVLIIGGGAGIVAGSLAPLGNILNAGFEQQLLIGTPSTRKVYEVIDTYVYRIGLKSMQYSLSTAVGLLATVNHLPLRISRLSSTL